MFEFRNTSFSQDENKRILHTFVYTVYAKFQWFIIIKTFNF